MTLRFVILVMLVAVYHFASAYDSYMIRNEYVVFSFMSRFPFMTPPIRVIITECNNNSVGIAQVQQIKDC